MARVTSGRSIKKVVSAKEQKDFSSPINGDSIFNEDELGYEDLRESFYKKEANIGQKSSRNRLQELVETIKKSKLFQTKKSTAITTATISVIILVSVFSLFIPNVYESTTFTAHISGGVALTEKQLRAEVKKLNVDVYWSGPQKGSMYTLNAQNLDAIYVRYLPGGKNISNAEPKFRVIATYNVANAYDQTLLAGKQKASYSIITDSGRALFFLQNRPTNIYLAKKGDPHQVEIFDPIPQRALELANSEKSIVLIK